VKLIRIKFYCREIKRCWWNWWERWTT